MEKRWTIKGEPEDSMVTELSAQLNQLDPTLCKLLIQRGIDTYDKAKTFFRPSLKELHDPLLFKNMDKAIARIRQAMDQSENIIIYGDYDVDGTTSVAMTYAFFSKLYANISYYIPDRYKEGYGVSKAGIDFAAENDVSLIIALDCGIKAIDQVAYAKEQGIDFIICDHHLPGEELPDAAAILDAKQADCPYPFKELSACGVGYKLIEAFAMEAGIEEEAVHELLDFVAVSTCADIVPMVGENRTLTHFGLKKLNSNPQAGFKSLLNIANNRKKELSVTDVVFTIAPRINAAGRIQSGQKAVEVLLAKSVYDAFEGGMQIDDHNSERKDLDKSITKEALEMIASDPALTNRKSTVLYQEHWHKGVIGIVASRCIESYYRPTIILTKSNGKVTGSARSVHGFDVYKAIEACSDLLEQFGGHKYAAGLTMKEEKVSAFQEKFEEVVAQSISDDLLIPEILIDAEITFDSINSNFYKILKQFSPFGPQNMRPQFVSRGLKEKGFARIVGIEHLKLDLVDPERNISIQAIAFKQANQLDLVKSGKPFDVVYTIEENEWNGKVSLQLNVKDIKPTES